MRWIDNFGMLKRAKLKQVKLPDCRPFTTKYQRVYTDRLPLNEINRRRHKQRVAPKNRHRHVGRGSSIFSSIFKIVKSPFLRTLGTWEE